MAGEAGRVNATIWHNPHCSKSRAALRLLEDAGAAVSVVEYMNASPSIAELRRLYGRAGMTPREGLRQAEGAHLAGADDAAILAAMASDPALIERPLVETAKGVVLARPPHRVHDIL